MLVREQIEKLEGQILSPYASLSSKSRGRERDEPPCQYRTDYQRDRDRIIHCKAFRRLKHKTQVFLSPEGDHYRTRLTHTLEVSQIARTIARALRLNEDLTEAISLGHDLGHTPFGHAGERALNDVVDGGFRHYEQSVRVVEYLEKDGKGLNLTWEVRDGILHHTCDQHAETLEGRIVRVSDRIAYINHDIDDAIRAGVLSENDIPKDIREILGENCSTRIDTLVSSIVENSMDKNEICMDPDVSQAFDNLRDFMFEAVYKNPVAKGGESKVDGLIKRVFAYFIKNPSHLPDEYKNIAEKEGIQRAACDYIAGMTDNYLLDVYHHLFIPRSWEVKGINFTG